MRLDFIPRHSIILASLILFACSSRESPPLRVGINPWPGYEFISLAQERGFYREEGVAVELVPFHSLSDLRRAYELGRIDGCGATEIEVLQARQIPDRDLKVISVVDYSQGADVIIGKKGRTGIRGARVGFEAGSLGTYMLVRFLDSMGLNPEDIQPVPQDQASIRKAFESGEIDLVVSYPPMSVELLANPDAEVLFHSNQIPGEVVDVIAFDSKSVQDRKEEVAAFLKAFHRAQEYWVDNRDSAIAYMASREGLPAATFDSILTYDVRVLRASDQKEYLDMVGGKISSIFQHADNAMRRMGGLSGPDRISGAWTDAFVAKP